MPDRNDHAPAAEETDFLDDDLDLDDLEVDEPAEAELPDAGPGEPELIDDAAADALLAEELEPLEASNGAAPLELLEPGATDLAEADVDLGDELEPPFDEDAIEFPPDDAGLAPAAAAEGLEARIARLEAAARALAAAEVTREGRRVRRKVSAATTGAGAVGAIPLLLQLAGAFDLDPAIVATASTIAAAIGAFVAGWATPERKPALPPAVAREVLSQPR